MPASPVSRGSTRLRGEGGFTFIELILSMAIIGIALGGTLLTMNLLRCRCHKLTRPEIRGSV